VEVTSNGALLGVGGFTTFAFALFLASFWNSSRDNAGLIVVAASMISFFCVNPYLLALLDWRHYVSEEAEALLREYLFTLQNLSVLAILANFLTALKF
jgi:hypothetical protein